MWIILYQFPKKYVQERSFERHQKAYSRKTHFVISLRVTPSVQKAITHFLPQARQHIRGLSDGDYSLYTGYHAMLIF